MIDKNVCAPGIGGGEGDHCVSAVDAVRLLS